MFVAPRCRPHRFAAEAGIGSQMVEGVTILFATGDGEHARAQDVAILCVTTAGLRGSAIGRASLAAMPSEVPMLASRMTPPSGIKRRPSKAAVTFLRWADGSANWSGVPSGMAGVTASGQVWVGVEGTLTSPWNPHQSAPGAEPRYFAIVRQGLQQSTRVRHPGY